MKGRTRPRAVPLCHPVKGMGGKGKKTPGGEKRRPHVRQSGVEDGISSYFIKGEGKRLPDASFSSDPREGKIPSGRKAGKGKGENKEKSLPSPSRQKDQ